MADPEIRTRNGWIATTGMYSHKGHNRRRKVPIAGGFRWRMTIARLILAVLFVNTLAPIWVGQQGIAGLSSTEGRRDAANQETVVLCTAGGLKLVRYGETREPAPEGGNQSDFCVLCLPFYSLGGGLSSQSEILKPIGLGHDAPAVPADAGTFLPAVLSGSACPRAPPIRL